MKNVHKNKAESNKIADFVTKGAVYLSAGVAGYGVIDSYGFDSPMAIAGCVAVGAFTVLSEIGAAELLVYAQRAADSGRKWGAAAIVGGFMVLTVQNVVAIHHGLMAIDRGMVEAKLKPFKTAVADAEAAALKAQTKLDGFDAAAKAKMEIMAVGLKGAMESGYLKASNKVLNGKEAQQREDAQQAKRDQLVDAKADADAGVARARAALDAAPKTRDSNDWWGLGIMAELLKGAFAWFAALGAAKAMSNAAGGIDPEALADLSDEQLAEAASFAGRLAMKVRYEKANRKSQQEMPPLRLAA